MPEMRAAFHHLRAHRAPENSARPAESLRKAPGGHTQTRGHRGRNRSRGARSHRTRTDHHRNRRNDHAPPQETGQSRHVRFASVYMDFKDVQEFMAELKHLLKDRAKK